MAKRKGKSRYRIKDYQQRYHADGDFDPDEAVRKGFIRREFKIPTRELSAGAEGLSDLPRAEGMVLGQFPGGAMVRVKGKQLLCGISGTYRPPEGQSALALGDIVTVALIRPEHLDGKLEIDKDRADGVILERQLRQTALCRPQPTSSRKRDNQAEIFEKVIVANMDTLLIVASPCQPEVRPGVIDRFLIIAERGELKPVLIINKIDLAKPDKTMLTHFQDLHLEILQCSAAKATGLRAVKRQLKGLKSVLAGPSGVGKSTLINAIIPGAKAETRSVRHKDNRGRHTTSTATVYDMPTGGIIVDTPGLRELGLAIEPGELPWYFPEFEELANQCQFRNCTHTHEPRCAVLAAVEAGKIPQRRYDSYTNILATLDRPGS